MKPLRCGVLGAGWMLGKYAEAMRLIDSAALVAVASRDAGRATAAASQWGIPRAHAGYESLVNDPEIDIVINALHNGLHCEWTIRALQAGKHVLCEKPLGCSAVEVERMFAAAHAHQRWLMEGFMYRFHPQIAEARHRLTEGAVGRVLHIRSSRTAYGRDRANPRYRRDAGGGALLDLGCYCVDVSRFLADAEPKRVEAHAHFDKETGVDLTLTGTLIFERASGGGRAEQTAQQELSPPETLTAQFVCSMEAEPSYPVEVIGTEGKLLIPDPWLPPRWPTELIVTRNRKSESIRIEPPGIPHHLLLPFALEVQHFCACIRENHPPQFPPERDAEQDSRANARVLDALAVSARRGSAVEIEPMRTQKP